MIKHFIHTGSSQAVTELFINVGDKHIVEVHSLINEVFKDDSSLGSNRNIMGSYLHQYSGVNVWHEMTEKGIINSHNKDSWRNYCQAVIYLSSDDIYHLVDKKGHIKDRETFTLFNKLSNLKIVERIMRYYLYNEEPSLTQNEYTSNMALTFMDFVFDQYVHLVDILEGIYEMSHDREVFYFINELKRPLNEKENKNSENTLMFYTNLACVPDSYPFYAYRNIYLKEWDGNRNQLVGAQNTYFRHKRHERVKYSMTKTESTALPYKDVDSYLFQGCHSRRCRMDKKHTKRDQRKFTRRENKQIIEDFDTYY